MFDLENFEKGGYSLEQGWDHHLSDSQIDYLRELVPDEQSWEAMSDMERNDILCEISQRYLELPLPENFNLKESIGEVFDPRFIEQYEQLEAPNDSVQIEAVSYTLANCEELRFENWKELELNEKVEVLNYLEQYIAAIEHRPPCPVKIDNSMGDLDFFNGQVFGYMGGYSEQSGDITLNAELVSNNSPLAYREMLDTLIHEGRHAYQDYNIHICEVHPRHSEVASWADTWGDGKWEYCGDTSTYLGQRLYEQQSIEIDARNFAGDVLNSLNDKLYA